MYFPASLRIIQLTFLFHDELKCAMGRLKEITVDSDIDFSLRKIVLGEVIGKKYMFNRRGHQKHHEKMWRLKKMLHCLELKRNWNNNISHVFFVSFSKGSSNTLLRFAESQWGEKLFGLADNNLKCYQTVLECLGIVSYKTDYFNAREINTLLLHSLCHVHIHSVFVLFNAMVYIIMSVWQQEARLYT